LDSNANKSQNGKPYLKYYLNRFYWLFARNVGAPTFSTALKRQMYAQKSSYNPACIAAASEAGAFLSGVAWPENGQRHTKVKTRTVKTAGCGTRRRNAVAARLLG
jgi:hypothetical protein